MPTDQDPVDICRQALHYAELSGLDTVILDTAGRLQIDEALMDELARIKAAVDPREILLVADAMTGQEAVNVASGFDQRLDLTGVILTKLDGDAKGGAALSIKAVTGKEPELSTTGGTSDARFIKDYCPVLEFGLVGQTMHQVDERTALADLATLTAVYRAILDRYFA